MILETVNSSAIHAIGYDKEYRVLEIVFNNGGIYRYTNVPREIFEGLRNSESKGVYFHERVRGRYENWRLGRFRRRWQRTGGHDQEIPAQSRLRDERRAERAAQP